MKHTDPQPLMTYSQWCTIFIEAPSEKVHTQRAVQRLTVAAVHPFHGRDSLWNDRTLAVFRLLITDQGGFHHDTRHKNRHQCH